MDQKYDTVPDWMCQQECYEYRKSRRRFVDQSRISILKVMSRMRFSGGTNRICKTGAAVKLSAALFFVVLTAVCKNMLFVYIVAACLFVGLCRLNGRDIRSILSGSIAAVIFTVILLLPSVFMGSPRTMMTVAIKVFVSVTIINFLSKTTPWNELTRAMKVLFIPDLFIFILDTALKYIDLAGRFLYDMLQALSLRTIGIAKKGDGGFGGVVGTTMLHVNHLSQEMYQAMECRGFDGTYQREVRHLKKMDGVFLAGMAAAAALFVFLELG